MWSPDEQLIQNLEGKIPSHYKAYMSKDKAYRYLKHLTGQDFGFDADAWRTWFREAERPLPNWGEKFIDIEES